MGWGLGVGIFSKGQPGLRTTAPNPPGPSGPIFHHSFLVLQTPALQNPKAFSCSPEGTLVSFAWNMPHCLLGSCQSRVEIRQVELTTRDSRKGYLARDLAQRCLQFRLLLIFCCWIGLSMLSMRMTLRKSQILLYEWRAAQPKAIAACVFVFLSKFPILSSRFFISF